MNQQHIIKLLFQNLTWLVILILMTVSYLLYNTMCVYKSPKIQNIQPITMQPYIAGSNTGNIGQIIDGVHVESGLIYDEGFSIVKGTCTSCHSSQLIVQNRATKEGWEDMIKWMQETQGLWDLGQQQEIIVKYLAKNYAPKKVGRRQNLENVDWYLLEE